jgi:hypothetical protein
VFGDGYGSYSNGGHDYLLIKISTSTGSTEQFKQMGSSNDEIGKAMFYNESDNKIILAGNSFSPGFSNASTSFNVMVINADATLVWGKYLGGV